MIKESEYCSDVIKEHFNKESVMTRKDDEDFENSSRFWIYGNVYAIGDSKSIDCRYHITGIYEGFIHRDCNAKVELNYKTLVLFHNLKNYDSHLIVQQLGKFDPKINIVPNGLEKYMSFNINNKLIFVDSFQFLSSLLDTFVKILSKNDF